MNIIIPMASTVHELSQGHLLKVKKTANDPHLLEATEKHCKKEYQKLTLLSRVLEDYNSRETIDPSLNQSVKAVSVHSPIPIMLIKHTDPLNNFEDAPGLVMTKVPGQEILLYSQLDNPEEKKSIYNNYAIALGKALQILKEQKLIHGDFRPRHTFYSDEKKIMSIIDVEGLAICGGGFQTSSQNKLTTSDILSNLNNSGVTRNNE
jgi:hypothetical protein